MTDAMRLLESWVADHQASVYRAAVMILRDEHAAQDVAQETFTAPPHPGHWTFASHVSATSRMTCAST